MEINRINMTMKYVMACCLVAVVAMCGCVHRVATTGDCEEGTCGYQHCRCEHAHMRSVLGISDEVLADTNRFQFGAMRCGIDVKLDRPILGCKVARFYLDEMDQSKRLDARKMLHRLRSVELESVLPDDATSDTLLREAKGVVGEIAGWLDVEPPDIELVNVSEWRKEFGRLPVCRPHSNICFDLADKQKITVRIVEGGYVVRDGRALLASPSRIEVDFAYNNELFNLGIACCMQESTNQTVKVEKELDIGDDCADKLAKAIRRESDKQAARRKKRNKPQP